MNTGYLFFFFNNFDVDPDQSKKIQKVIKLHFFPEKNLN